MCTTSIGQASVSDGATAYDVTKRFSNFTTR